jgi:hypothetical protein
LRSLPRHGRGGSSQRSSGARQLIANTTTDTGLTVACRLDDNTYEKGITVSDDAMAALNIQPANFHGEWNYTFVRRRPDG